MEKKLREAQTGIAGESCAVDDEVVAAAAAAARRAKATGKHAIAAFDFDGTSIQGNSPVLLVRYLRGDDLLRKRVLAKVGAWGAAYKLHLPQSEAWVRGQVFTAFEGGPKEQVDEYLRDFYDKVIAGQKRFRPKARAAMNALRDAGVEVVIVSATFGPIVRRAQEFEPFNVSLCTEMEVDANGNYTRRVDGECVEGEAKVRAITKWANEKYGAGNWELSCAFGDHHSDIPMLSRAADAFAVTPDSTLSRTARENDWHALDWNCKAEK
ncbi:HAD family hydrolase [Slackia isoflavoniconvertens]|uniref:HAD family hydrolase n=1 Tax=Slackia isoflavoniconvertens TaxID=572010 RepID=UPI00248E7FBD|nr:HAD-IB family hydrolase [Slackia isoflavoniconvertens]